MDRDELEPRRKSPEKPDLSSWSRAELEVYIVDLQSEIERARQTIMAKTSHLTGAEALFRKPG